MRLSAFNDQRSIRAAQKFEPSIFPKEFFIFRAFTRDPTFEPQLPFLRDNPDEVRQARSHWAATLRHQKEASLPRFPNCVLNRGPGNTGSGCNLSNRAIAHSIRATFCCNNPQNSQFANRKGRRQGRRHHAPRRKRPPSPDRSGPFGRTLDPARRINPARQGRSFR